MINYSILESLVGTDKGSRTRFVEYVLGQKVKRSLTYFRDHDVTFSTAEKICDYLHISMDMLRLVPTTGTSINGNNNNVGNISINSNIAQENKYLKAQVEQLNVQIEQLQTIVTTKNELLAVYKEKSGIVKE